MDIEKRLDIRKSALVATTRHLFEQGKFGSKTLEESEVVVRERIFETLNRLSSNDIERSCAEGLNYFVMNGLCVFLGHPFYDKNNNLLVVEVLPYIMLRDKNIGASIFETLQNGNEVQHTGIKYELLPNSIYSKIE